MPGQRQLLLRIQFTLALPVSQGKRENAMHCLLFPLLITIYVQLSLL